MKIQLLGAEYVSKLDICKMHVQNTKRTAAKRRIQVTIKRDGNSLIQIQTRRKIMRRKNQSKMKATKQKLRRHPLKNLWNHNWERTQIHWKSVEPKGSTLQRLLI